MKALVCLVIIAILVVVLWPEMKLAEPSPVDVSNQTPPPASAPLPVIAGATPLPRHFPIVSEENLVILRGQIVNRVPAGLLVSSALREPANSAASGEKDPYGPLLISVKGQWQPAKWTPEDYADGLVILAGDLPPSAITPQSTVNIIVAKTGNNAFTTEYEPGPIRATGWMWKKRGNPLEPPVK